MSVRLVDLEPRWLPWQGNPHAVLMFRCPCCRKVWLTCVLVLLSTDDQIDVIESQPDLDLVEVVPCREGFAWTATGVPNVDRITITPSLDASAAGHWHGFVRDGAIA